MPPARPRRRRRRGRGAWSVGVLQAGRAVLVALWSLGSALAQLAMALVGAPLARAWRWLRGQDRPGKLAIAAAAACLVLGWAHLRDASDAPADDGLVHLDSDVEALARVIRSEIGTGTAQQKLHIAWATRNLAAQRDQTIARMACSPCGRQGRGRPVSTRQPATDSDRELARLVLAAPELLDPTGGATNFINPRLQDELARSGRVPGYAGQTYQRVQRRWRTQYGWEPYYRLGPDLELWGAKRSRAR